MNWSTFRDSELYFLRNFIPVAADLFLGRSTEFIATFYSSLIGADYYVTGIGIASQMTICTIGSFIFCFGTIFECFAGATIKTRGKSAVGILLYKSCLQSIVVYMFALAPFLCLSFVIPLFGEDEQVHAVAVRYLQIMSIRPLLLVLRDFFIKYLVVQGYWYISLPLTAFCGVPTIIFLGWLFVVKLEWGVAGLATAQYTMVILSLFVLAAFVYCKREEMELSSPSRDVFVNWGQMVKLGVFAGLRGLATFAVSAFAIALCQVSGPVTAESVVIIYRVLMPFGATAPALAYAQAIMLGNAMGKQNRDEIKYSMKLGSFNLIIDRVLWVGIFLSILPSITRFLTEIPQVRAEVAQAAPMVGVMLALRGTDEFLARGILTPLAKQLLIAVTSLVSVYLFSTPIMTWLIYDYHVNAVWIFASVTLGMLIQSVVYIGRLVCLDIDTEIARGVERTALNTETLEESERAEVQPNGRVHRPSIGSPD